MNKIVVHTDGGSRGNPGPGAVGFVVFIDSKEFHREGRYIGQTTNNQAEYQAVIDALDFLKSKKEYYQSEVLFKIDSELVARQLNGQYKVRDPKLKPLFLKIREILADLAFEVSFMHVRREENEIADSLVNNALDKRNK